MTQSDQSNSACALTLTVGGEPGSGEPGHSRTFEVGVSYEEALDRLVPISQPSSSLQARELMTWPLVDGGRLWVPSQHVAWVEELR